MLSTPHRASNRDPCFSPETAFSMSKGQAGVLVRPRAAVDGADIAWPAEFPIGSNGKILWVNLTEAVACARPQALKGLRLLGVVFRRLRQVPGDTQTTPKTSPHHTSPWTIFLYTNKYLHHPTPLIQNLPCILVLRPLP
jgi:hypothetical protein